MTNNWLTVDRLVPQNSVTVSPLNAQPVREAGRITGPEQARLALGLTYKQMGVAMAKAIGRPRAFDPSTTWKGCHGAPISDEFRRAWITLILNRLKEARPALTPQVSINGRVQFALFKACAKCGKPFQLLRTETTKRCPECR